MTVGQTQQSASDLPAQALKIDVVVHGRFHGLALARALIDLGHDVLVHTNYPAVVVTRFGVPRRHVKSFLLHGLSSRAAHRIGAYVPYFKLEAGLHQMFGRWAARSVRADADIVYGFTGVMEEFLKTPRLHSQLRTIVRGSAHIRQQSQILFDEANRVGVPLDQPTEWIVAREEREYQLADKIFVLSDFARRSFMERGADPANVHCNPLGVDVSNFRGNAEGNAARQDRILSGEPLRILSVGTFSYRKGAQDFAEIVRSLSGLMQFRFVGDRPPETKVLAASLAQHLTFIERVPENMLREHYAWADVFIFPTLEDGFAAVLLQASAAGLPIIATTNCSAPDFLQAELTGWVVPIRSAEDFISRLRHCDENRALLAEVASRVSEGHPPRNWRDMARELLDISRSTKTEKTARHHDR